MLTMFVTSVVSLRWKQSSRMYSLSYRCVSSTSAPRNLILAYKVFSINRSRLVFRETSRAHTPHRCSTQKNAFCTLYGSFVERLTDSQADSFDVEI
jgi:hypothetical protein